MTLKLENFDALKLSLASPETILSWSHGEVTKPETINYRTLKPERDGLFCERIFGPQRDWECHCGKYKRYRYKGIICDKCGVEVTRSKVRRERMGHIKLASPVSHVWYFKGIPSRMGLLLDMSPRNLEKVLYFANYIVTYIDEEARQEYLSKSSPQHNDRVLKLQEERDGQLKELKEELDQRIKARQEETRTGAKELEERLDETVDELTSRAKSLVEKIKAQKGKKAATNFTIGEGEDEEVVIAKGTVFEDKLARELPKQVEKKIDALQAQMKKRQQEAKAKADEEVARWREEFEGKVAQLDERLKKDTEGLAGDIESSKSQLEALSVKQLLTDQEYREFTEKFGKVFKASIGAQAIKDLLNRVDLVQEAATLREESKSTSGQRRQKAIKRLKVVEAFRKSAASPTWMILDVLPVIPPELRPMVQLDGGRFATSDLNDLYRRVINRNNRLKRLLELGAPDVIIRNEKRMLQEAVDSLIDNSQRGKALSRRGRRELKSLSDMLKGKKGRFRRNLLGKRVDYSGRSVIVVGPQLKLYQCGLPKSMALELYRPFVIARLVQNNYAPNVKGARRLIERNRPEVWEALEGVIGERPVLLNRAPTLHRLGIQAFEPILIEGSAIQLHPLVTTAFNADFDGDQMAVHVPLSQKAVQEARELMLASKNLLKPADGEPIISPSKDMVLGVYYLTMKQKANHKGDGRAFADMDEVEMVYSLGQVEVHSEIKLRATTWYNEKGDRLPEPVTRLIDTTVGRVLFNRILPADVQFVNEKLDKGGVKDLIAEVYEISGQEKTTEVADKIKALGFEYAMKSGTTLAVADISIPPERKEIIEESLKAVELVQRDFRRGLLTEQEKNEREIEIWQGTTDRVADAVKKHMDPDGNLSTMASSGATKGGFSTISQLAGMRGLMADPSGRIIPMPIRSNFREGLTAQEYFISTHGARKGLADTALRTADAGYLTRRLVDIAQDIIINEHDCGTRDGVWIRKADDVAGQSIQERILGRCAAKPHYPPSTGQLIVDRNGKI